MNTWYIVICNLFFSSYLFTMYDESTTTQLTLVNQPINPRVWPLQKNKLPYTSYQSENDLDYTYDNKLQVLKYKDVVLKNTKAQEGSFNIIKTFDINRSLFLRAGQTQRYAFFDLFSLYQNEVTLIKSQQYIMQGTPIGCAFTVDGFYFAIKYFSGNKTTTVVFNTFDTSVKFFIPCVSMNESCEKK